MSRSSPNGEPAEDDGPEDKTADDLFQELADAESSLGTSADGDEIYEELSDDSPEEIIAAADEDVEDHPVDDAILPDEDALQELLLSDRKEEDGFLWVDTGDDATDDDPFESDVVDEWSDAFAAASDETLSSDAPPAASREAPETEGKETDDSEPEIAIEVPDPDEVDGARADEGETGSSDRWDPESDATAAESSAVDQDDADTEASADDDVEMGTTTDDSDDDSRIFDVEPDDGALASTVDESQSTDEGEDGSTVDSSDASEDSDDSSPGLIARLLSVLPF